MFTLPAGDNVISICSTSCKIGNTMPSAQRHTSSALYTGMLVIGTLVFTHITLTTTFSTSADLRVSHHIAVHTVGDTTVDAHGTCQEGITSTVLDLYIQGYATATDLLQEDLFRKETTDLTTETTTERLTTAMVTTDLGITAGTTTLLAQTTQGMEETTITATTAKAAHAER